MTILEKIERDLKNSSNTAINYLNWKNTVLHIITLEIFKEFSFFPNYFPYFFAKFIFPRQTKIIPHHFLILIKNKLNFIYKI